MSTIPELLEERREMQKRLDRLVETLKDISMCCGYDPEHLGAENYDDPGIVLSKEIISELRKRAEEALKECGTQNENHDSLPS